ncbi:hypothetical protein LCM17_03225 [Cereibacter sphaeroides]|nr:hypothetical protein [Cereibacter sphaeroides]
MVKDALPTLRVLVGALMALCASNATATEPFAARAADSILSQQVVSVAVGSNHSCAVSQSGGVWCWGFGEAAALGPDDPQYLASPRRVPGMSEGFLRVATGNSHSCALHQTGQVFCWGYNGHGQLGDGSEIASSAPVAVRGLQGGAISIAAGGNQTCAITFNSQLYCWGSNLFGQLGTGDLVNRNRATRVSGIDAPVDAVAMGLYHSCALTRAGQVSCWGENAHGQLGDGSTVRRLRATIVSRLATPVDRIAAAGSSSCAVTNTGRAYCWGANGAGQLDANLSRLVLRPEFTGVRGVRGLMMHSQGGSLATICVQDARGRVFCWGDNTDGALGAGTDTILSFDPLPIAGLGGGVRALAGAARGLHACAVDRRGRLQCWGRNVYGTLGDGTTVQRSRPVLVQGRLHIR